jgi:hypothetical protein
MSGSTSRLIDRLAGEARPTRPLPAPWRRTLAWLAALVLLAALALPFSDLPALLARWSAAPDLAIAAAASLLTAILAALAAFQTALPDRSPRWALLPLPALALWIGASGAGCLRPFLAPDSPPVGAMGAMRVCFAFVLGSSLPLGALLFAMIRRACPLRPGLTASLAGLACAAGAAAVLTLVHPHDATALDLSIHAVAVVLVVLAARAFAPRL